MKIPLFLPPQLYIQLSAFGKQAGERPRLKVARAPCSATYTPSASGSVWRPCMCSGTRTPLSGAAPEDHSLRQWMLERAVEGST